jgi:hypothetical protein
MLEDCLGAIVSPEKKSSHRLLKDETRFHFVPAQPEDQTQEVETCRYSPNAFKANYETSKEAVLWPKVTALEF